MRSTCVNEYKVHVTRSFNDSTGMLIMCDTCFLQDNEKLIVLNIVSFAHTEMQSG